MALFRQSLRSLARRPAFSLSIIAILGIGIGASTAAFTTLESTVLRLLPLPDSDRLVVVREIDTSRERDPGQVSLRRFQHLEAEATAFEQLAAISFFGLGFGLTTADGTVGLPLARATHDYFPTLGIKPMLGRNFRPDEDEPGSAVVALIPYRVWQSYLGGEQDIIGKTLPGSPDSATIVGVLPPTFIWPLFGERLIWFNFGHYLQGGGATEQTRYLDLVGRLRDGADPSDARAQVAAIAASDTEVDSRPADTRVEVLRLQEVYLGDTVARLWTLFGVVQVLLCLTVANTLIAFSLRLSERRRELAVRQALGGGGWRLVQLVAVESGVLALIGCAAGLGLALMLVAQWQVFMPFMAHITPVRLNLASLAYSAVVVVAAVAFICLAPIVALRSSNLAAALKGLDHAAGRRWRVQTALIAGQIALSAMILAGAAMMLQSEQALKAVPVGFDYENVVQRVVLMTGPDFRDRPETWKRHYAAIEREVRALPFVSSAAFGTQLLQPRLSRPVSTAANSAIVEERTVGEGYFRTLKIPLAAGREFNSSDGAAGAAVAMLSRAAVSQLFGDSTSPIGRSLTIEPVWEGQPERKVTIVGVAEDVRYLGPRHSARPAVYLPLQQSAFHFSWLYIRGAGIEHAPQVDKAVWSVDAALPTAELHRLGDSTPLPYYRNLEISSRVLSFSAIAATCVLLVGTFGLVAFAANQQRRCVALRYALGAGRADIYALLTHRFLIVAAVSATTGVALAWGLSPAIESWLFEVEASNWRFYAAAATACIALVLAAALLAVRRTVALPAAEILRSE